MHYISLHLKFDGCLLIVALDIEEGGLRVQQEDELRLLRNARYSN